MCKDCDSSAAAEKRAAIDAGYAGAAQGPTLSAQRASTAQGINLGGVHQLVQNQKLDISERVKHLQDAIHRLPYGLGRDAASVKLQEVEMWAHKAIFPG